MFELKVLVTLCSAMHFQKTQESTRKDSKDNTRDKYKKKDNTERDNKEEDNDYGFRSFRKSEYVVVSFVGFILTDNRMAQFPEKPVTVICNF